MRKNIIPTFIKNIIPKFIKNILVKIINRKAGIYSHLNLNQIEITDQKYKQCLGGGTNSWDTRGNFQLFFLKKMGLNASCSIIDVGCGPLRAGTHIIKYLNAGNYYGLDYNKSFINSAKTIITDNNLSAKNPKLYVVRDFNFKTINRKFDFALVFSVLNHCDRNQINRFFNNIPSLLNPESKVFITHAHWFNDSYILDTKLKLNKRFDLPEDIEPGLDIQKWGWVSDSPFPILELTIV